MAKAYINISIANLEEAKEKAAELVETLSKAKNLLTQLNEMDIVILDQMVGQTQE